MDNAAGKHIVISAVNIRKGGTLTILRECLQYLSSRKDLRVTAIVHDRSLCDCPGIEYIEIPWSIQSWAKRIKCEYFTLRRISDSFEAPADLWFSLHDSTPRVAAARQAVYCHNPFPFMKANLLDWRMNYKIPLFCMFSRYIYKAFVRRNSYLVVQQQWLREGLAKITGLALGKIIVAPPSAPITDSFNTSQNNDRTVFFYPSFADRHKTFETLLKASQILQKRAGKGRFRTIITVKGDENRYARWLKKQYGHIESIDFHGFVPREDLKELYGKTNCLVFPSRVETWGLPISEFLPSGKPMILADLAYAHETAAGAQRVTFFPCGNAEALAEKMAAVLEGDLSGFKPVGAVCPPPPTARSWEDIFDILLKQ